MTASPAPRSHTCITLFVPGRWSSAAAVEEVVRDAPFPIGLEWIPNDGTFGKAFSFGTCTADEVRAIDAAGGAVVLELPVELNVHRASIATLARALRDAGALAFRIEQSKLGFMADAWVDRVAKGDPLALLRLAAVTLGSEDATRMLGLHVFSLPDLAIEATGREAVHWLDVMAVYSIAEDPVFVSGNTFAPNAETPRRMMEWWPDTEYPQGHPCNNPYGVLRLGPTVERGRPQPKLRLTFIPALAAILTAAREKKGAALESEEIIAIRDAGSCVAMEWEDAREMERSRGYADIDPERAVECWNAIDRANPG